MFIHIQNKMKGGSPFHDKMLNNLENFLREMKATKETLGAICLVVKDWKRRPKDSCFVLCDRNPASEIGSKAFITWAPTDVSSEKPFLC